MKRRDLMKMLSRHSSLPMRMSLIAAASESPAVSNMIVINALGGLSNQNLWVKNVVGSNESVGRASILRMRSIDKRAIVDTHSSGNFIGNRKIGLIFDNYFNGSAILATRRIIYSLRVVNFFILSGITFSQVEVNFFNPIRPHTIELPVSTSSLSAEI